MKRDSIKKVIWSFVSLALAILTVKAVLDQNKRITLGQLIDSVGDFNKVWFVVSAICALLYVWFEGIAIRTILKDAGYPRKRRQALIYSTADVYFSAITPSATGGQPASALFMIKDGVPAGVTTAALVLNLIMYNAALGVLGIIALIISPGVVSQFSVTSDVLLIFGAAALILLSLFFFFVLRKGETVFGLAFRLLDFFKAKGIVKSGERTRNRLIKASGDYSACSEMISGRPELLVKAFIWNLLQRTAQITVPMFLYISAGGDRRRAAMVFSKQCLINIGYNYIPIPGAMGVADYLMLDGFKEVMGGDMAYRIELLSRGITFYLCVTLCGIITLIAHIVRRKRK